MNKKRPFALPLFALLACEFAYAEDTSNYEFRLHSLKPRVVEKIDLAKKLKALGVENPPSIHYYTKDVARLDWVYLPARFALLRYAQGLAKVILVNQVPVDRINIYMGTDVPDVETTSLGKKRTNGSFEYTISLRVPLLRAEVHQVLGWVSYTEEFLARVGHISPQIGRAFDFELRPYYVPTVNLPVVLDTEKLEASFVELVRLSYAHQDSLEEASRLLKAVFSSIEAQIGSARFQGANSSLMYLLLRDRDDRFSIQLYRDTTADDGRVRYELKFRNKESIRLDSPLSTSETDLNLPNGNTIDINRDHELGIAFEMLGGTPLWAAVMADNQGLYDVLKVNEKVLRTASVTYTPENRLQVYGFQHRLQDVNDELQIDSGVSKIDTIENKKNPLLPWTEDFLTFSSIFDSLFQ